ncbi:hypothetical protein Mkiyose1665_12950 [Mycobacterium kiyosense]|uniref:Uncharacterized protein n=1 Tax=Mycobacterium kiyosense TaxID=2871094 RepID=A0A9P3Q725_9MYCO|nr:hypothetical protein MKCMC460_05700 [Mycobacterium sp. 20KCMC460]GLB85027.1 hypothetical protein SRL2020028_42830 [Mycobacterium kiyosense]GLB88051.1 hypothetical protein SRL2020130_08680 [Mycobacterium kiyosense]GLB95391.1 hypothetical protein SRL2020226_21670 [Mycobacterium kiyosense]GLC01088.1 hypothetical protein SRL2020400_16790 [Mycobacterium kiyosense]
MVAGPGYSKSLQVCVVCPADVVAGGEGLLDDLELVIHSGFQLEDHAAVTDRLRLENYVPLAPVGDGIARMQIFDGHQFGGSV